MVNIYLEGWPDLLACCFVSLNVLLQGAGSAVEVAEPPVCG